MSTSVIRDLLKRDLTQIKQGAILPHWEELSSSLTPPGYIQLSSTEHDIFLDPDWYRVDIFRFRPSAKSSDNDHILKLRIHETPFVYTWKHVSSLTSTLDDPSSPPIAESNDIELGIGTLIDMNIEPVCDQALPSLFPHPTLSDLIGDTSRIDVSCRCCLPSELVSYWQSQEVLELRSLLLCRGECNNNWSGSAVYQRIHSQWCPILYHIRSTYGDHFPYIQATWIHCCGFRHTKTGGGACEHAVLGIADELSSKYLQIQSSTHLSNGIPNWPSFTRPQNLTVKTAKEVLSRYMHTGTMYYIIKKLVVSKVTLVDLLSDIVYPISDYGFLAEMDGRPILCNPVVRPNLESPKQAESETTNVAALNPCTLVGSDASENEKKVVYSYLKLRVSQSDIERNDITPFRLDYQQGKDKEVSMRGFAEALWIRCKKLCDSGGYVLGTGSAERNMIDMSHSMCVWSSLSSRVSCGQGVYFFRVTSDTPNPFDNVKPLGDSKNDRDAAGFLYSVHRAWTEGLNGHSDRDPVFFLFHIGSNCLKSCPWLSLSNVIDLETFDLPMLGRPLEKNAVTDDPTLTFQPHPDVCEQTPYPSIPKLNDATWVATLISELSHRGRWSRAYTNAVIMHSGVYDCIRGIIQGFVVGNESCLPYHLAMQMHRPVIQVHYPAISQSHSIPVVPTIENTWPWLHRIIPDATSLQESSCPYPSYEYIIVCQDDLVDMVRSVDKIEVSIPSPICREDSSRMCEKNEYAFHLKETPPRPITVIAMNNPRCRILGIQEDDAYDFHPEKFQGACPTKEDG